MTVENQTNKTAAQVMGSSYNYDFSFTVLTEDPTEEDAKEAVKVLISDGTTTQNLTYGTDYTVTLNANGTGGRVTVFDRKTSDWTLIVYREYEYTQGSDYNNYNAFPAETLERNLDKLTMITQQLFEESSRSVKVGMFSDADPSEIVNEIEVVYANKDDVIAVAQSITDVNAVSADLTNVDIVATNISNVNTVAGDIANVNTVAGDKTNIDTVAGDISRVGLVADDIASVHTVAVDISNVIDVAGNKTNIDTVAGVSADVSTVAGIAADVSAVAAIDDDVSDVADDLTNIDAVAGDLTNIDAVAGDLTNIDAVAGDLTNVDAVSSALTNVGTVAGSIANVNAVGTGISNVNAVSADLTNINTAATNISDINTAATNIAAIIDAPNQASAAAASAALAKDWASKTDGPVEGSEYSAKWYALNTDASGKADKDLSNLSATGKGTIAALVSPDYLSSVDYTSSWGTDVTTTKPGWVFVSTNDSGYGSQAKFHIGQFSLNVVQNSSTSYGINGACMFFVPANATWKATGGNNYNQQLLYFPCKGA